MFVAFLGSIWDAFVAASVIAQISLLIACFLKAKWGDGYIRFWCMGHVKAFMTIIAASWMISLIYHAITASTT